MRLVRRIRARFIYCVQEKAKGNEDGSFAAFRMTRGGVAQARGNKKPGFPACAGNDVLRGRVRGALPSLRSGERRKAENKIQKTRRWILRVAQDDKEPWAQARGDGVHGALQGAGAVEKIYICIGGPARNARWGLGGISFKGSVGRKEGIKVVVVGLGCNKF